MRRRSNEDDNRAEVRGEETASGRLKNKVLSLEFFIKS